MTVATIGRAGEIVIPQALRERLNLQAGDRLEFSIDGENTLTARLLPRNDHRTETHSRQACHVVTVAQLDRANAQRMTEESQRAGWIPTSWSAVSNLDDPEHT